VRCALISEILKSEKNEHFRIKEMQHIKMFHGLMNNPAFSDAAMGICVTMNTDSSLFIALYYLIPELNGLSALKPPPPSEALYTVTCKHIYKVLCY
jgi:hypothetical protein